MFDIGFQEMLVIGVLALLVFGPGKLPELGRMIGRALREFRRASDEFRSTVETNLHLNDPDPIIPPASAPVESAPVAALPSETGAVSTAVEPTSSVAVEPGEPYCAQRSSRLFHKSDCAWVSRIPEAERAYFKHVAEARDQGFTTCPVCEPWEPA
ncbi:MAG TPA: twin-arginine translocase TatA/TatE family subunit [Candidatus Binatia bacterium]|nr:twin-arginine translocase TatA/TatE family subunit [Candidatus Binatia bacterium]